MFPSTLFLFIHYDKKSSGVDCRSSTLISLQYAQDFTGKANYVPASGTEIKTGTRSPAAQAALTRADWGDGTVPLQSLRECTTWAKTNPSTVCR